MIEIVSMALSAVTVALGTFVLAVRFTERRWHRYLEDFQREVDELVAEVEEVRSQMRDWGAIL